MAVVNRTRITAEWRRGGLALRAAALLVDAGLYADAISRMYYAVLHATTAALLPKGFDPATHRAAMALLNQRLIHTGELERRWLNCFRDAMNNRRAADYDAGAVFTDQQAADSYEEAAAFCARIHRYLLAEGFTDAELAASR